MPDHSLDYYLDCVERGIQLYWRTLGKAHNMLTCYGDIEYVMSHPRGGPERVYRVRLSPDTAERRVDEIITGIRAGAIPNGLLLGRPTSPKFSHARDFTLIPLTHAWRWIWPIFTGTSGCPKIPKLTWSAGKPRSATGRAS